MRIIKNIIALTLLSALGCNPNAVEVVFLENKTFNKYELFNRDLEKIDSTTTYLWNRQTQQIDTVWIKGGDLAFGDSKVRLNVIDRNRNGKFNDTNFDEILLSQYNKDTVFIHRLYSKLSVIQPALKIAVDSSVYLISNIEESGNSLEMRLLEEALPGRENSLLRYYSKIPEIEIEKLTGEKVKLSSIKEENKVLYLDLWHRRCKPCLKLLPEIDSLQESLKDKATIIALNTGDELEDIGPITKKLQLQLPIYRVENIDLSV